MNCSDNQIPRNKSLFNQRDSSQFGRHVNEAPRKSLEIEARSITKPRTHPERKFLSILLFSCSYTS